MNYLNVAFQDRLRERLRQELAAARNQTDRLFNMLAPSAMHERPIPERHRIVFYLGHLEAFDWNMVCRWSFGASSFNPEFDRLFAFGIDPINGQLPQDQPVDWPKIEEIRSYNQRARRSVDEFLDRATFINSREPFLENGLIFRAAIEHRFMHAETLAYMLHWLPDDLKERPPAMGAVYDRSGAHRAPLQLPHPVEIPAGLATLGQTREDPTAFGWDNEFDVHSVVVPEFSIDALNITNQQFLDFLRAGGYEQRLFWDPEGWQWLQNSGVRHPKFWIQRGGDWFCRTMFDEVPLPLSWPVYVSHAEAQAYARWVGKSLPTEAQFHRAAFGSSQGERYYPWGGAAPGPQHGNFNFQSWTPRPVGAFPSGRSAFGVFDLVGNGWEWTGSVFGAYEGFQPFPFYPGYSANFFDGKHYVMKGASPRTASSLVRRSFRNWFQPLYPNIYATFRCVEN